MATSPVQSQGTPIASLSSVPVQAAKSPATLASTSTAAAPATAGATASTASATTSTAKISSAALNALQEARETPAQTAAEARSGDLVAKRLVAKQQAQANAYKANSH